MYLHHWLGAIVNTSLSTCVARDASTDGHAGSLAYTNVLVKGLKRLTQCMTPCLQFCLEAFSLELSAEPCLEEADEVSS